ncbi:MAG: Ig-like domain-containing protein [Clostridiales bacterium]|nr:Ig-like domain-containing protein [Clostridiales bacterium]
MTKLRNKIVLVLLALCLAVCAGLFVACGGDTPQDNSVTYTVTVKAGDSAAEGVKVTVKKGSTILGKPVTTGVDGKAEFSLAEDAGYTVTLDDLPRGYKVADGAELKFDGRNLTVTLEEMPASYTIKLVNYDNTAYTAAGVLVGICTVESNNCLELVEPDANGIVKIYDATKTDYHIQIKGLPAGYAFESDGTYAIHQNASGNYTQSNGTAMVPVYTELTDTVVEQTIKIYPVNVIKLTDDIKISDAELESDYWYVDGMAAYKMDIAVEANSTVYYEYTADYSGDYYFYSDKPDELTCKLNESFLLGDSHLSGNGMFNPPVTLEKGKKYYLNVTNNGDEKVTAETILSTPYATYTTVTGAGTVKAESNKQGKNATIELDPTAGSTYKLTVNGNGAIKQVDSETMVEYTEFDDADYTDSKEVTVKYTEEMQGNLYFAVSVKADSYPAAVEVKIEKIGTHTNNTIVVNPTNLTKTADNDDFFKELAPVALDATVVKGTDGKYHLGSETGPVVYVNLMGAISPVRYQFNNRPLVYMEQAVEVHPSYFVFDTTSDADKAATDKGNTYKDFRIALRGFDDYKIEGNNLSIPVDLAENYYAKNVNSDDVYPLDDTLKEYLELAAPELGTEWLFACYYYTDYAEPDAIVGEYETEDGQFVLTIQKFGEFTIIDKDDALSYYELGTWTKSDGEYLFEGQYGEMIYVDGSFIYSDWMGDLTFEVPADPIVGEYEAENGDTLAVYDDGTFIWITDQGVEAGLWEKNGDNYTFIALLDDDNEVEYDVYVNEGVLEFFNDPDAFAPAYTFTPAGEEEDGDPDFADLLSEETWVVDPTISLARLGLYNDGKCVLWQYRGNAYVKIATASWDSEQDGNVTISGITVADGYEYEITANYAQGVVTVTLQQEDMDDTVYTFTMQQA